MKPSPVITRHAIERYQQRVDAGVNAREAALAISRILDSAAVCSRPRRWSRVIGQAPGTRYLYSASQPGVCLVVAGGAVVTVHSRPTCAAWRNAWPADDRGRSSRPRRDDRFADEWRTDAA
jgi:hypothetical protein